MPRLVLIVLFALALQGCAAAAVTFAGANVVSLMQSDKTAVDHGVSLIVDQDCSVLYAAEQEAYCRPLPASGPADEVAALAERLYCYKTRGGVSCYDRPDFGASAETRINYAYGVTPAAGPGRRPAPDLAARPTLAPAGPKTATILPASAQSARRPSVVERSLGPAAAPLPPLRSTPGLGTY